MLLCSPLVSAFHRLEMVLHLLGLLAATLIFDLSTDFEMLDVVKVLLKQRLETSTIYIIYMFSNYNLNEPGKIGLFSEYNFN